MTALSLVARMNAATCGSVLEPFNRSRISRRLPKFGMDTRAFAAPKVADSGY
jgi:hypothetical protein